MLHIWVLGPLGKVYHMSYWSLGRGSQGNPARPIRDCQGLLGIGALSGPQFEMGLVYRV